MGFSGFYRLVFDRRALIRNHLVGGIFGYGEKGGHLVRIRIYGIMGFSGFYRLVFGHRALIHIRIGGIFGCGEKRGMGEVKS